LKWKSQEQHVDMPRDTTLQWNPYLLDKDDGTRPCVLIPAVSTMKLNTYKADGVSGPDKVTLALKNIGTRHNCGHAMHLSTCSGNTAKFNRLCTP
jgi:hypothetical protein